jgi:prepilin-type N-terminal cleavage/methylation domain-containing protein
MKKVTAQRGNSLIEVLIAVTIVGIVLTGVALSLTVSAQNSSEAEYRQVATRLAQEVVEVFRQKKSTEPWTTFYNTPGNATYCIPADFNTSSTFSTNTDLVGIQNDCANPTFQRISNNPPMTYYRAVTKSIPTTPVDCSGKCILLTVDVVWNAGTDKERSVKTNQLFYRTE